LVLESEATTFLVSDAVGDDGPRFALLTDVVRIGRADDNDVVLRDPRVSRRHAELVRSEHHFELRDLGSRNGTFVNGQSVVEPIEVASGDRLTFGGVHLQFQDGASTIIARPVRLLSVDDRTAEVRVADRLVSTTPKEYVLLRLLVDRNGQICDRNEIASAVWPEYDGQVADYNIDNLVARLRAKLDDVAAGAVRILAVKTRGYRLVLGSPE
jgi:pSer/pThr/pTyr-binding forkhead associated (FHA) protein